MNSTEKRFYTDLLKRGKHFEKVFSKLLLKKELNKKEKIYVLTIAIVLFEEFKKDNRKTSFVDLSYAIILKYSIQYLDFRPLYEFSINFGFYPIVNFIIENDPLFNQDFSIIDYFGIANIKTNFSNKKGKYIETYEQNKNITNILNTDNTENAFIAPTSFGKSSLIIDYIQQQLNLSQKAMKIAVIVPTKSLLQQTYQLLKNSIKNQHIISHDEMYRNNDKGFIAVFTQERALRLMNRHDIVYDILIIDEAHNLFNKDSFFGTKPESIRSILLARLIKLNKNKNKYIKLLYLSPLVNDTKNLAIDNTSKIKDNRIKFNIKEPELYDYFEINKTTSIYNRFLNTFHEIDIKYENFYSLLKNEEGNKNFIFEISPRNVELVASKLEEQFEKINDLEIQKIASLIRNEIHSDYKIVKSIEKGIIYLHAKIPDFIKEYLEYNFRTLNKFRYLVANSVVLEGINMPIDRMFLLSTHNLSEKELVNLIGRVNRLDSVFNKQSDLEKLCPKIYFVDTAVFKNRTRKDESKIKHITKIQKLRTYTPSDKIENPLLENFKLTNVPKKDREIATERIGTLKVHEKILTKKINDYETDEYILQKFLQNDIINMFHNIDQLVKVFKSRLKNDEYIKETKRILTTPIQKYESEKNGSLENNKIIQLIYLYFIKDFVENINDLEFTRLNNAIARNYYRNYIYNDLHKPFSSRVNNAINYYKDLVKSKVNEDSYLYVTSSYGEYSYDKESKTFYKNDKGKPVYINLTEIINNQERLVNIAVVKQKMEEDFISFKLNKFISLLFDFNIIKQKDYDLSTYGTTDQNEINLAKFGFTPNIIRLIREGDQLENIILNEYDNIQIKNKDNFNLFLNTLNELDRFHIEKML